MAEFMPTSDAVSLHAGPVGQWLHVHQRHDQDYKVTRYALREGHALAEDVTHFHLGDNAFVESKHFTSQRGPNLHLRPITLPAMMPQGRPFHPLGGHGSVTLLYCGPIQIQTMLGRYETEGIALMCRMDDDQQVAQWLAKGVGPISLGLVGQAPMRWMTHYHGEASWPWRVEPSLLEATRVPLPEYSRDVPRASLT